MIKQNDSDGKSINQTVNKPVYQDKRKELPIYLKKDEIISVIENNMFCIIIGETGSGKTTQLPQYILEKYKDAKIVITQPRKVAAIQMAKRVAYEMGANIGDKVGYTIRFSDVSSKNTQIRFVTDGILVRECLTNLYLENYDFIILDEAHERSLFTDILFALAKKAAKRSNGKLKIIITSATLNKNLFSTYFDNCPILNIEGKMYPVEINYNPCKSDQRIDTVVSLAIRIHLHEEPGHILVFLTGFEECELACSLFYKKLEEISLAKKKALTDLDDNYKGNKNISNIEIKPISIFPLYGSQDADEQSRIFEDTGCRKLIFSTNIAETSLTIDGIVYIIDSGYVKQKVFNARTGMDYFTVNPISKVQATQRLGRAGRTSPGKCIRLYTQEFFELKMNNVSLPEILRVNLSTTVLTLKTLGINDVMEFDLIDKPSKEYVLQALKHLYFIQAIDQNGVITDFGKEVSKFPIDCSYARALLCSRYFDITDDMLALISLISSENIWFNINKQDDEKRQEFENIKNSYMDDKSDLIALLNIYKEWKFIQNKSDIWCKENYIKIRALRQTENIISQLSECLKKANKNVCNKFFSLDLLTNLRDSISKSNLDDYDKINCYIRICLAQGFFMNAVKIVVDLNSLNILKRSSNSLSRTTPMIKFLNEPKRQHNDVENTNLNASYIRLSDNTLLGVDSTSCICVKGTPCELLIYTELISGTSRPIMKQVSVIDIKWIVDKISLLKNLNVSKLMGSSENNDSKEFEVPLSKDKNNNFSDIYSIAGRDRETMSVISGKNHYSNINSNLDTENDNDISTILKTNLIKDNELQNDEEKRLEKEKLKTKLENAKERYLKRKRENN